MTQKTSLTVSVRAIVGALVIAAAATGVVLVSSIEAPEITTQPLAIDVDTTQDTSRTLVCNGGFAELGADAANPNAAVSTGDAVLVRAGAKSEESSLAVATDSGSSPVVLQAGGADLLAAAQLQNVKSENLRGAVASACTEPLNEQWLIGGDTATGVTTTLNLGNTGSVPANVQVTVYDAAGEIEAVRTAGVIVAPGTQQMISVNGYAPDREQLAVRVSSTGAPVAATLNVAQRVGLSSFGVSMVDSQAEPSTDLVIAGIANAEGHNEHANDAGEGDSYPVFVRAFAPGGERGTVTVRALDDKGHATALGSIELETDAVGELIVTTWPEGSQAIEMSSTVPIVAAALGSAETTTEHDYDWFTPSPVIDQGETAAVAVVQNGKLVLVHPGEGDAEVTITDAKGKAKKVKMTAGATRAVAVSNNSTITATAPIYAGVRYMSGANIAGYPVLPESQRDGSLTVYTR